MVEVIVLSDDEGDEVPNDLVQSTRVSKRTTSNSNLPSAVKQDQKRPYKIVLVDSRRCPLMPRPRYLPIAFGQDPFPEIVRDSHRQSLGSTDNNTSAEAVRSPAEIADEEEDPDYQDVRPTKRRRTGAKKVPKKHGRLTAADWDIVRNGGAGVRHPQNRPTLPAKAVSDRKEARDYVKRLTANVDWEEILRHLEMLRLNAAKSNAGETDQNKHTVKPRRGLSQANRLKQYWQSVLMKSMLKMHVDCSE